MLGECQVNVKSQSQLDIGGRETCSSLRTQLMPSHKVLIFTMQRQRNSCDNGPFLEIIINGPTMKGTVVGKEGTIVKTKMKYRTDTIKSCWPTVTN